MNRRRRRSILAPLSFNPEEVHCVSESQLPEPWLRGTLTEVPPVQRAVLHALESATEDLQRWCAFLTDDQINARPFGLAPVAFHVLHISRSTDRLLTYAEGRELSDDQLAALKTELTEVTSAGALFVEFRSALSKAARRVRAFDVARLGQTVSVGRKQLPTDCWRSAGACGRSHAKARRTGDHHGKGRWMGRKIDDAVN